MNKLQKDLIAGFSVFLLALPLCLGIALASHFPPSAGIMTAIIGGIVTSFLGGAKLTIKGPAAGLIVIVLASVMELGQGDLFLGYKRTLAVGVIAAILQIIIALRKKAVIAEMMPPSVIHGMLAAIGVIIIAKQSYVLIGARPSAHSILGLIADFPLELSQANPIIIGIGLLALGIILIWPKIKTLSFIPSSVIVIAVTIPLSLYFDIKDTHTYHVFFNDYILDHSMLVTLPTHISHAIHFPDFSYLLTFASAKYIIMFAIIGSIESLLTVCAIDSLTKPKPATDLNKDLLSLGLANFCSSLIGGLPMIAEIVRSKANIEYGATSGLANFFHGFFMLLAAIAFTQYINLIPLSALAALLIYVGCKLASPKSFIHAYRIGTDQLAVFITTFMMTLLQDLLTGVMAGIILKLFFHILRGNNLKQLFTTQISLEHGENSNQIYVSGPLTFVSYLKLKRLINHAILNKKSITIDFTYSNFVDHTIMAKLEQLKLVSNDVLLEITGMGHLKPLYNHDLAAREDLSIK